MHFAIRCIALLLLLVSVTMTGNVACHLELAQDHHASEDHSDTHGDTMPHLGGHAHCLVSLLPTVLFLVVLASWAFAIPHLPCGPLGFVPAPFIPPRHIITRFFS